ncbi:hypothetical protein [Effusibacillus consociatus]|uniref:Flagellar motor switch protein FliG C-terminal domain-containing protein n=1 Tax=Effusibacillus consociatus TaxID=1117041 RepID=A0ABV9Q764_9BACL
MKEIWLSKGVLDRGLLKEQQASLLSEKEELIKEITKRTNLPDTEVRDLVKRLAKKEVELELVKAERFFEILFDLVSVTDIIEADRKTLEAKFKSRVKSLPGAELEFLFENGLITNDWTLSEDAHGLINQLKARLMMESEEEILVG